MVFYYGSLSRIIQALCVGLVEFEHEKYGELSKKKMKLYYFCLINKIFYLLPRNLMSLTNTLEIITG